MPFPYFIRHGPRADDFVIDEVLDRLVEEAVGFIDRSSQTDDPFFLYLPLTAPHKPTQPHERFRGRTGLGEYGDFVAQVDDAVGRVLAALERAGGSDETLVIFTSDNGSYMYRRGDTEPDHVVEPSIQAYRVGRHRSNADWRGTKADIWEGGHRVPFVVRWPGVVEPGTETAATVVHTDLYATLAHIVGVAPGPDAAEDSVSLLPMLRGEPATRGVPVVHHSSGGMFAVRDGRGSWCSATGRAGVRSRGASRSGARFSSSICRRTRRSPATSRRITRRSSNGSRPRWSTSAARAGARHWTATRRLPRARLCGADGCCRNQR